MSFNDGAIQSARRLCASSASDRGTIRNHNEDAWFAAVDRGLFIVGDGLGGHAGGEVAAAMVVKHLPTLLDDALDFTLPLHVPESAIFLENAINKLNRMICDAGQDHPELAGMGSTVVLAMIQSGELLIAHVGDSRAYLLRDSQLERLTKDHSAVQVMLDDGLISPDEAVVHPSRSIVSQCIGSPRTVTPSIRCLNFQNEDRLLLCSDGLTNMLADQRIEGILKRQADVDTVSRDLIQAAIDAGGEDNVTVVVVEASQVE